MNALHKYWVGLYIVLLGVSISVAEEGKQFDVLGTFTASGWMGDGKYGTKYVQQNEAFAVNPHSAPTCVKVSYVPGPEGWAGVYWQNKADNWGDKAGDDLKKAKYKNVTFWARGEKGGEVVEFKAGGVSAEGKKYRDSFEKSTHKITLGKEWAKYSIDLQTENLSSVIGGFCWVAALTSNPGGLTFYVDDVYYEP